MDHGVRKTTSKIQTSRLISQRTQYLIQFLTAVRLVASICSDVGRGHDLFHSAIGTPFPLEGFLGATQPRFGVGEGYVDVSSNAIRVPVKMSA